MVAWGRVCFSAAGWFRLSRSLALTCWFNRLRGGKLVEPACSFCELVVSKPVTWGRVCFSAAGWFRLSRSLALTCWLNRLQGDSVLCRDPRNPSLPPVSPSRLSLPSLPPLPSLPCRKRGRKTVQRRVATLNRPTSAIRAQEGKSRKRGRGRVGRGGEEEWEEGEEGWAVSRLLPGFSRGGFSHQVLVSSPILIRSAATPLKLFLSVR